MTYKSNIFALENAIENNQQAIQNNLILLKNKINSPKVIMVGVGMSFLGGFCLGKKKSFSHVTKNLTEHYFSLKNIYKFASLAFTFL